MTTTDSVLRGGLAPHGDELHLTLDPRFQGLPDTAHGGSVLAAFDAAAGLEGPRQLRGVYRKRVPLGVPLRLALAARDGGVVCRLFDEADAMLVDGGVSPGPPAPDAVTPPGRAGDLLPVSPTCFVCGTDNPLGLHARLFLDDATVWGRWDPPATMAAADGSLAPIALTGLLDEAAFWLGAAASGESGMTTELAVTLHRPVVFGAPIVVTGSRGRTRARGDDTRYWDTEVAGVDAEGRLVASGRIAFVAVRGAARRLVQGLLARNPPDVLRRIFPAYTR